MEKESNIEDWLKAIEEQEQQDLKFITEVYDFSLHSKEIAYHEAGHFLIDCLVLKEKLGFTEIIEAQIFADENVARGNVRKREDPNRGTELQKRNFYLENINRCAYKILTLCAGYATYLKYFDNDNKDYYIGIYEQDRVFRRYNLINFPTYDNGFDYLKIKNYLSYYKVRGKDKLFRIINYTNEELIRFMSNGGNKSAIGFVKNMLLQHNKTALTGDILQSIIEVVNVHTKRITISKILTRISLKIQELGEE